MTQEQAKQMLPILTAWANGEEIQFKFHDAPDNAWENSRSPVFNASLYHYRIKPKPREFWLCRDNGEVWEVCEHQPIGKWDQVIKLREILDQ